MILYNVTVNIDQDVSEEWLQWMKNIHIPDVLSTGLFLENKIARIHAEEEGGVSYSIQYLLENWKDYKSAGALSRYILWGEPSFRESVKKYKKRFNLK